MVELRILSGLHRGATLPLDDNAQLIGASDDADVVLVDDCIKTRHALLSRTDTGWVLSADEGTIFDADTNLNQAVIDLMPGDFARLGDIWITIVLQDAPWVKHPMVPVDVAFEALEPVAMEAMEDVAPVIDVPPLPTSPMHQSSTVISSRKKRYMVAVPVMAMVVLSAAAAYALAPRSMQPLPKNIMEVSNGPLSQAGHGDKLTASDAPALNPNDKISSKLVLSSKELAKAFQKQLADADLLKRFDLTLGDKAWTMKANLDDEETARFERILPKFMRQYQITFPVSAKVVSADNMLPFKIRQVISGPNANVVTQDGQRLFVGEEYLGVRVVAIQGNHLSFAGKRKIEMNW